MSRMEVGKPGERKGSHTFADLKGMLAGQGSSSEAEIDAGLYQITPEFEEERATLPRESDR